MNLQTLSELAEIFSFLAVAAVIIFGLIQIRQFQRQRRDSAAIELVRSVQDSEFTKAFRLIHSLPEGISAAEFTAKGTEYVDAALALGMKYETIGLLVFKGVVPISTTEELVGGVAITLWKRLSPWVDSIRAEQSQELFLEWFQWLVNKLEERNRGQQEPAYKRFHDWKPRD
jgi:hypothetical protein